MNGYTDPTDGSEGHGAAPGTSTGEVDTIARAALVRMGLARDDEPFECVPLTGGVSSEIVRVDLTSGPICLKRALARLKVAAEWRAPVERSADEVAWMRAAVRAVPGSAPEVLGVDEPTRSFAMSYLDPATHPLWKAELRAGRADSAVAAALGERLAAIHRATADDPSVARTLATDTKFHAIRIEPYLLATAARHRDLALALEALAARTAETRRALVHGDVSPKNILVAPGGPMLLDAECAWFGDPAFDVAFCLNHLLLKCRWVPEASGAFLESFDALARAYLAGASWEPGAALEARIATLLPGLLLARVDGKSPVEYLADETARAPVREVAREMLAAPAEHLGAVRERWAAALH